MPKKTEGQERSPLENNPHPDQGSDGAGFESTGLSSSAELNPPAGEAEDSIIDSVQEHGEDGSAAEENDAITDYSQHATMPPTVSPLPGPPASAAPTGPRETAPLHAQESGESSDAIQDSAQSGRDETAFHTREDAPRP